MMKKDERIKNSYGEMKKKHGETMLILFHVKECYEAYYSDASIIAEITRIPVSTCTPEGIPLIRFPADMLEHYRNLLLDAGLSVCTSEVRGTSGKHILKTI